MMGQNTKMTKGERAELGQLIRKRERVMKSLAIERSAEMLAEFDTQLAAIYDYDNDETWANAEAEARKAVDNANQIIAARCVEMGIPKEFAPSLGYAWIGRGQNAITKRRTELRRMAKSRIEAVQKQAVSKIERMSLEAQTEVIANGLESEAARTFLEKMPTLETLMPLLDAQALKAVQESKKSTIDLLVEGFD